MHHVSLDITGEWGQGRPLQAGEPPRQKCGRSKDLRQEGAGCLRLVSLEQREQGEGK